MAVQGELDVELREPLVLRPPLRLAVRVDPPFDPAGALWRTVLMGVRDGDLKELAEGQTTLEGRWESKPLRPGRYIVRIRSRAGAAMAWRALDLTADLQELAIELDLVRVEGEVRLGDRPLAARLWFGGRSGSEQVEAESDREGAFSLLLPRPGRWRVDLYGVTKPVRVVDREVEVRPSSAAGVAEVEIVLPDTRLAGRVRDESGNAVPGAGVNMLPLDLTSRPVQLAETDGLGRFEVEGLSPGNYSLEASHGSRTSDRAEVLLADGLESPPIELVVKEHKRLRGRVVAPSGPIAGASLLGLAVTSEGTMASTYGMDAHSGLDGGFELRDLPATTAQVRLVVTAPGHVLALRSVPLPAAGEEVVISLGLAGGRLELPAPAVERRSRQRLPLVLIDGQAIDVEVLRMWARAHETTGGDARTLRIDAMPEGNYAYCELPLDAVWLVLTGAALPARDACTEGFLSAGGSLALGSAIAQ